MAPITQKRLILENQAQGELWRPIFVVFFGHALADRTVLIRSDCTGAISALRKGSFRSPALQNVALLHNRLFMDVGASPQHYLHAPGTVMKAEGVDDLSLAVARSIRASTSTPALRERVAAEAERWLGAPLSLDLFATADNALVPRTFPKQILIHIWRT